MILVKGGFFAGLLCYTALVFIGVSNEMANWCLATSRMGSNKVQV